MVNSRFVTSPQSPDRPSGSPFRDPRIKIQPVGYHDIPSGKHRKSTSVSWEFHYFNGDLNHSYVQLPEGIPLSLTVIVVNEINLATHLGPLIATT